MPYSEGCACWSLLTAAPVHVDLELLRRRLGGEGAGRRRVPSAAACTGRSRRCTAAALRSCTRGAKIYLDTFFGDIIILIYRIDGIPRDSVILIAPLSSIRR